MVSCRSIPNFTFAPWTYDGVSKAGSMPGASLVCRSRARKRQIEDLEVLLVGVYRYLYVTSISDENACSTSSMLGFSRDMRLFTKVLFSVFGRSCPCGPFRTHSRNWKTRKLLLELWARLDIHFVASWGLLAVMKGNEWVGLKDKV